MVQDVEVGRAAEAEAALVADATGAASVSAHAGDDQPRGNVYGIFLLRDNAWKPYWLNLPRWVAESEAELIEGAKVFVRVAA